MKDESEKRFGCQSFQCMTKGSDIAHLISDDEAHWIQHRGRRLPFCKAAYDNWELPARAAEKLAEAEVCKGAESA